jgi:hypothetical protein
MIAIFPELAKCVLVNNVSRLTMLTKQYYAPEHAEGKKLNVADLINNIGIQLCRGPIKELAVILAKDSNGIFEVSIILNNKLDLRDEEHQFLLAHLLGHFFWHIQPKIAKGEWGSSGFRELVSPYQRFFKQSSATASLDKDAKIEHEADLYAASLLGIEVETKPVSFAHAEHKLKQNTDNFGQKQPPAPKVEAPLHSDQVISAKMPRSFAASSYDQMKNSTTPVAKSAKAAVPKTATPASPAKTAAAVPASTAPVSEAEKEQTLARGLDRLRKLAKRIDRSVE